MLSIYINIFINQNQYLLFLKYFLIWFIVLVYQFCGTDFFDPNKPNLFDPSHLIHYFDKLSDRILH